MKNDPLLSNMLTIGGQKCKDRRSKLTPTFTSGKIKMMFEFVDNIADNFKLKLNENIENCDEIEMYEWLSRFSTDVIGNIAFGLNCNCLEIQKQNLENLENAS
jgi:cytochrome P450 family 6